jgi:hypothetical protein
VSDDAKPDLKVLDGGKSPQKKPAFQRRGTAGRWQPGTTPTRAAGLPEYERAVPAYLKQPGNHKHAGAEAGLDPRTCRRMWELGLLDPKHTRIAPPIKEVVAERVRLVQQRAYGDMARAHQEEAAREKERAERQLASKEELENLRHARALTWRVVAGYLRGSELVGAMLSYQVDALFDVSLDAQGRRVLTPKQDVEISLGDTVKAVNAFALGSARLVQAAKTLRNQGVRDRATVEKLERALDEQPADLLNEQVEALREFARDVVEGRVVFEDPEASSTG